MGNKNGFFKKKFKEVKKSFVKRQKQKAQLQEIEQTARFEEEKKQAVVVGKTKAKRDAKAKLAGKAFKGFTSGFKPSKGSGSFSSQFSFADTSANLNNALIGSPSKSRSSCRGKGKKRKCVVKEVVGGGSSDVLNFKL